MACNFDCGYCKGKKSCELRRKMLRSKKLQRNRKDRRKENWK